MSLYITCWCASFNNYGSNKKTKSYLYKAFYFLLIIINMNEGNQTPSQLVSYINAFLSTIAKLKLVSSLLKASKITINDDKKTYLIQVKTYI